MYLQSIHGMREIANKTNFNLVFLFILALELYIYIPVNMSIYEPFFCNCNNMYM